MSAIQSYGKNQLLVLERSILLERRPALVKVFLCDLKRQR
jgi:hypothetical protein